MHTSTHKNTVISTETILSTNQKLGFSIQAAHIKPPVSSAAQTICPKIIQPRRLFWLKSEPKKAESAQDPKRTQKGSPEASEV